MYVWKRCPLFPCSNSLYNLSQLGTFWEEGSGRRTLPLPLPQASYNHLRKVDSRPPLTYSIPSTILSCAGPLALHSLEMRSGFPMSSLLAIVSYLMYDSFITIQYATPTPTSPTEVTTPLKQSEPPRS